MPVKFNDIDLKKVGHEVQLIGGIWASADTGYLCYFPEYGRPEDVTLLYVEDMGSDEWKKFLRQTDLMETEVLSKAQDGKLYKAVVRKCQRQIDQQIAWNVYKRDQYACRYCGRDNVPLTVDHLILWEEGGPSTEENMVASCKRCNKTRGDTPYPEWLKSRRYKHFALGLSKETIAANLALVETLDSIERVVHVRSR